MAVHLYFGRVLSATLTKSLVVSLAVLFGVVLFGAAAPARADHYLTHPASEPAGQIAREAFSRSATMFKAGTEIKIKKDASVYITARNIRKNDRLLEAYNADRSNGGRIRTRAGEATAVPGLLGIANQAHRAQDPNGQNNRAYSLADAMRDAIWRRNTAARLRSLTASQSACAEGTGKGTPSIGLAASC